MSILFVNPPPRIPVKKATIGLTIAKEVLADTKYGKQIKIRDSTLQDILNSPKYQRNLEQKIIRLVKIGMSELMDTGLDFKEKSVPIRKTRKVGRPKKKRRK